MYMYMYIFMYMYMYEHVTCKRIIRDLALYRQFQIARAQKRNETII